MKNAVRWSIIMFLIVYSCLSEDIELQQEILIEINSHRDSKVAWNDDLEIIAMKHSVYMNEIDSLSHKGRNGITLSDKLTGYRWTAAAENISHAGSAKQAVDGWMMKDCHRAKILNEEYRHIGAAEVNKYWTLILSD